MRIILSPLAQIDIKKLSKKYKNISSDLDSFIKKIKHNQSVRSDRLQGFSLPIYKTRLKNSSISKGKSGGFRVIYHLKINDTLYILTIYSKSNMTDIDRKQIAYNLKKLDLQ